MTGIISEIEHEVVEDFEELFPPKPGGLVDKYRRRKAAAEAAAKDAEQAQEKIEGPAYKAVKVALESPEVFSALTYTIAAGGSAMILPASPYRYRAVVSVVTAASTVIVAKDQGAALGQAGFTLATGTALPLQTRAQVWAYNPGGSPVQVSVLAEIYAAEDKA